MHHACNHYAGLLSGTWFRDVSSCIDTTNKFVSHLKSVITGTWQAVGASGNTAGAARNELLSRLQPLNTMFSAAVGAGDAETLLCCCANRAADWAAEGSRQLKHVLCAQDDALANMAEHTAKQLESQGDSYLSQGDKLLSQGSEGRIIDVLTNFVRAKAAYDEANSIKSFGVNRPSKVSRQVTPNVSCLHCLSFFLHQVLAASADPFLNLRLNHIAFLSKCCFARTRGYPSAALPEPLITHRLY
jgi:hypothetical protein